MLKLITLLKRRPGMSVAEFKAYYETHHARLGEKFVPNATRYVRRFVEPMAERPGSEGGVAEFDVVMELWFENQDELDKAMARLAQPEVLAEIEADEAKLFDRKHLRAFVVTEECESPRG